MRGDDGHRAGHCIEIVEWSVFFDGQPQRGGFLFDCVRVFPNILAGDNVICDGEGKGRHVCVRCQDQMLRRIRLLNEGSVVSIVDG